MFSDVVLYGAAMFFSGMMVGIVVTRLVAN